MKKKYTKGLMWFRRDLRLTDNAALYHALKQCDTVFCIFVFDKAILDPPQTPPLKEEHIRKSKKHIM